jgi:hypothetical protein
MELKTSHELRRLARLPTLKINQGFHVSNKLKWNSMSTIESTTCPTLRAVRLSGQQFSSQLFVYLCFVKERFGYEMRVANFNDMLLIWHTVAKMYISVVLIYGQESTKILKQ